VRKLGEGAGAIQASPGYAAELGRLRSLGDARWITWGEDLGHLEPARFVAEQVPAEAVHVRTSHLGTQLAAARVGAGVVLIDRAVGRANGLVEVSLTTHLQRRVPHLGTELWLVAHRALRDVPRVAAVWEFLVEEAGRLGYAPAP
jgi:DNA-binding transcriptional LysR family regulator